MASTDPALAPSNAQPARSRTFELELNPFEQSFSGQDGASKVATPVADNKSMLPSVSQVASPSSVHSWSGLTGYRTGPLSPAMLPGPTAGLTSTPGFDPLGLGRTGLTPNESGIRTGLTPIGISSSFPTPSPTTAALLGFPSVSSPSLTVQQSDSANVMKIAAPVIQLNPPSLLRKEHQAQKDRPGDTMSMLSSNEYSSRYDPTKQDDSIRNSNPRLSSNLQPIFPGNHQHHEDNAAANGLYMLSQAQQERRNHQQQQQQQQHMFYSAQNNYAMGNNSNGSDDNFDPADINDNYSKSKRGNSRVKKEPLSKRSRTGLEIDNNNNLVQNESVIDHFESEYDIGSRTAKSLTEEEKRRSFLERNRQAAFKCRQRKKQWLANLQAKVEFYTQENESLTDQVQGLREEVKMLKQLLVSHKGCSVSQANGGAQLLDDAISHPIAQY